MFSQEFGGRRFCFPAAADSENIDALWIPVFVVGVLFLPPVIRVETCTEECKHMCSSVETRRRRREG